ncbi:MAG: hypothetical protein U5M23_13430 [Marinagarivorans sp.]|nr:hypothetical protein [Marinagarivorans sp.]
MSNEYTEKAMRAANSAAAKVFADALLHQRPLPIWKNGKVEYILPTQEQVEALKARSVREDGDGKDV